MNCYPPNDFVFSIKGILGDILEKSLEIATLHKASS